MFAQGFVPDSLPVWKGYVNADEVSQKADSTEKKRNDLQTKGSKSFQTSVGDGGTDIQQELRLSMKGEAADGIFIDAYLVDLGRPAGTEVTTTLREVDAAYIGVEGKHAKLELGDLNYEINRVDLFGFHRQTLGVRGKLMGESSEASAIYGRDKTERQSVTFRGQASQQKGYILFSDSLFGVITPNTEKVYLNGILLTSGIDYELNYAGGILDFIGKIIPGPEDEIRVEYDSYSTLNSSELKGVESAYRSRFIWLDLAGFNLRDSTKSDKMVAARVRAGGSFLYSDLEVAMNQDEDRAYRWFFSSDSNYKQKSFAKVAVKGYYADSGFSKPEYEGNENQWDAYILRDKWLLDSVPSGDLRYDEATVTVKLPLGLSPGYYIGHRNFESLRNEGFLLRETQKTQSKFSIASINTKKDSSLKQTEIYTKFTQGIYRPYGNFKMDSEENLRSIYGLEWGDENQSYANTELMREQTDSSGFSNWKNYFSFKGKDWNTGTLFQIRKDKSEFSWLLDQSAAYNNPNSFLQGEIFYTFNYTNEVPWIPIYRKVPSGTGDVYYDSLSNQYISGVDKGDFVYEGLGRVDSLAKRSSKNDLRWDLSMHPKVFIENGFLHDITFFAEGEWLYQESEKLLLLENSALWEHPKNKGSLMLIVNNKWDKIPQIKYEEVLFGQEVTAHYRGREKEDYSLRFKREKAEFALNKLDWISYEGELSWLRELGSGFSVQPFYFQKYSDGFYTELPWNARLQKSGITGRWQNERGSLGQIGISGNYVDKSSEISPYSAVDGFDLGFSWRANALVQITFNEHFYISAEYIARMWHSDVFQKLNLDAKAVF